MQKNPYAGKFIVFEGLDGSGQTTQAALLKDFLIREGHGALLTKEPTIDSSAGEQIRRALDKIIKVSLLELQKWFAQDRREHLDNLIIPALKNGKIIISDRYFFSTFAYGASGGIDLEWLIGINNGFFLPDLTFILKVSPGVCMERIGKRGEPQTLFEEKERLEKVWQIYQAMPERFENVYIIDGERSADEVHEDIKNLIRSKLNL